MIILSDLDDELVRNTIASGINKTVLAMIKNFGWNYTNITPEILSYNKTDLKNMIKNHSDYTIDDIINIEHKRVIAEVIHLLCNHNNIDSQQEEKLTKDLKIPSLTKMRSAKYDLLISISDDENHIPIPSPIRRHSEICSQKQLNVTEKWNKV